MKKLALIIALCAALPMAALLIAQTTVTSAGPGFALFSSNGSNYIVAPFTIAMPDGTILFSAKTNGTTRVLMYDSLARLAIDVDRRTGVDENAVDSTQWGSIRLMLDNSGASSVDWQNRLLMNSVDSPSIEWDNYQLDDIAGGPSVRWASRILTDSGNNFILYWGASHVDLRGGYIGFTNMPAAPTLADFTNIFGTSWTTTNWIRANVGGRMHDYGATNGGGITVQ